MIMIATEYLFQQLITAGKNTRVSMTHCSNITKIVDSVTT